MTDKLTEEQAAILKMATQTKDNFAVMALAGTGKTFTLKKVAAALSPLDILCIAFNKAIASEMAAQMPPNCTSKTMHALGYKAWAGFLRKSVKVEKNKVYDLVIALMAQHENDLDTEEMAELREHTGDLIRAVAAGKNAGWLPEGHDYTVNCLIKTDEEFFDTLPTRFTSIERAIIRQASLKSFQQALDGSIDFDDMVFCPTIGSGRWDTASVILIDEAQDLGPINHAALRKMVRYGTRLIAVGDPQQAIYGFRGALTDSMEQLEEKFSMKRLHLSMTFRCGYNIVENVHWRVPSMVAADGMPPGSVERLDQWRLDMIKDGDAVICRNNAPLFRLALRLMKEGRSPEIRGRDIGKSFITLMNKLMKDKKAPAKEAHAKLVEWRDKELARARNGAEGLINDQFQCISLFLNESDTLGGAIKYLKAMLERDGRIYLMTGHKAKGLEFDRVFFLNAHLCNLDYEQDQNLKYVIETRARKALFYINTSGLVE